MSVSPWTDRLLHLASLEDGWLDGDGRRIDPEAVSKAELLLDRIFPKGDNYSTRKPGIFPMESGGIVLEWYINDSLVSVEIDPHEDELFSMFHLDILGSHSKEDNSNDIIAIAEAIRGIID